jgi:hypothetical protein
MVCAGLSLLTDRGGWSLILVDQTQGGPMLIDPGETLKNQFEIQWTEIAIRFPVKASPAQTAC